VVVEVCFGVSGGLEREEEVTARVCALIPC